MTCAISTRVVYGQNSTPPRAIEWGGPARPNCDRRPGLSLAPVNDVAPIELSEEGPKDDAKPSEHLKGASREMG